MYDEDDDVSTDALSVSEDTKKGDPQGDFLNRSHESIPAVHSYQIKPSLNEKFKESPVKEIIRNVIAINLSGRTYDPEQVKRWTIKISNEVNEKVKELQMKRYKHVVQVIIGEKKGAGVKSGLRCLWDSEVDGFTSEIYMTDTFFCVTTVFAVYLY